jgi:hypothetical protein
LLRVSAAIIALLAVIGALALFILGSAAIIRNVAPEPDAEASTVFSRAVVWAWSLNPPAWLDEQRAARATNVAIRSWSINCGFVSIDANEKLLSSSPIYDRLRSPADALFYERSGLAREADNNFSVLEWATIASILIGLATTVFAGLRSDDEALGSWKRTVSILAIVFPALGTAVAACAAFYGPREQLLRVSQSLVALQQLHTEMQNGLTHTPCPTTEEERHSILQRLDGWEDKLIRERRENTAALLAAIAKATDTTTTSTGLSH